MVDSIQSTNSFEAFFHRMGRTALDGICAGGRVLADLLVDLFLRSGIRDIFNRGIELWNGWSSRTVTLQPPDDRSSVAQRVNRVVQPVVAEPPPAPEPEVVRRFLPGADVLSGLPLSPRAPMFRGEPAVTDLRSAYNPSLDSSPGIGRFRRDMCQPVLVGAILEVLSSPEMIPVEMGREVNIQLCSQGNGSLAGVTLKFFEPEDEQEVLQLASSSDSDLAGWVPGDYLLEADFITQLAEGVARESRKQFWLLPAGGVIAGIGSAPRELLGATEEAQEHTETIMLEVASQMLPLDSVPREDRRLDDAKLYRLRCETPARERQLKAIGVSRMALLIKLPPPVLGEPSVMHLASLGLNRAELVPPSALEAERFEVTVQPVDGGHARVNSSSVSALHVAISCSPAGVTICDLGSTNGTYLKREGDQAPTRVVDGFPEELPAGCQAELILGQRSLCLQVAPDALSFLLHGKEQEPIRFEGDVCVGRVFAGRSEEELAAAIRRGLERPVELEVLRIEQPTTLQAKTRIRPGSRYYAAEGELFEMGRCGLPFSLDRRAEGEVRLEIALGASEPYQLPLEFPLPDRGLPVGREVGGRAIRLIGVAGIAAEEFRLFGEEASSLSIRPSNEGSVHRRIERYGSGESVTLLSGDGVSIGQLGTAICFDQDSLGRWSAAAYRGKELLGRVPVEASEERFTIGRGFDNHLKLPNDPTVSEHHLAIKAGDGEEIVIEVIGRNSAVKLSGDEKRNLQDFLGERVERVTGDAIVPRDAVHAHILGPNQQFLSLETVAVRGSTGRVCYQVVQEVHLNDGGEAVAYTLSNGEAFEARDPNLLRIAPPGVDLEGIKVRAELLQLPELDGESEEDREQNLEEQLEAFFLGARTFLNGRGESVHGILGMKYDLEEWSQEGLYPDQVVEIKLFLMAMHRRIASEDLPADLVSEVLIELDRSCGGGVCAPGKLLKVRKEYAKLTGALPSVKNVLLRELESLKMDIIGGAMAVEANCDGQSVHYQAGFMAYLGEKFGLDYLAGERDPYKDFYRREFVGPALRRTQARFLELYNRESILEYLTLHQDGVRHGFVTLLDWMVNPPDDVEPAEKGERLAELIAVLVGCLYRESQFIEAWPPNSEAPHYEIYQSNSWLNALGEEQGLSELLPLYVQQMLLGIAADDYSYEVDPTKVRRKAVVDLLWRHLDHLLEVSAVLTREPPQMVLAPLEVDGSSGPVLPLPATGAGAGEVTQLFDPFIEPAADPTYGPLATMRQLGPLDLSSGELARIPLVKLPKGRAVGLATTPGECGVIRLGKFGMLFKLKLGPQGAPFLALKLLCSSLGNGEDDVKCRLTFGTIKAHTFGRVVSEDSPDEPGTVLLADPLKGVSRKHFTISADFALGAPQISVQDSSANGTFLWKGREGALEGSDLPVSLIELLEEL